MTRFCETRSRRRFAYRIGLLAAALLAVAGQARAQEKEEERTTGLPKKIEWTFNLDAGAGAFGFGNSLYTDVRPDASGNLGDNWFESSVKPGIGGVYRAGSGSELYAKVSGVGERTLDAPPPLVGTEASSFKVEDLYIGWRSGTSLGMGENAFDFTVGRTQYRIGHGMLLWDGAGEGGSRGGFWSNARKAWQFATVGRFNASHNRLEGFYLDRDELPESDTGTKLYGGNYEFSVDSAKTVFGATYMHTTAATHPSRDGMNVYNLRLYSNPLKSWRGLGLEGEYAREENGDLISSIAWTAQGSIEIPIPLSPRISYRYAFFQGDDPATPAKNEAFDMLFPGFYDWGTWWQGEIAGEYFIANSNMITHQVRLHLTPSKSVSGGLIGFAFRLDQPATFGTGSLSNKLATELDAYTDWKLNKNFTISLVAAFGHPEEAAQQAYGRTSDFTYGMIYVAYSY